MALSKLSPHPVSRITMRSWLALLGVSFFLSGCNFLAETEPQAKDASTQAAEQARYYRPAQQLDELFRAVQIQQIFADSKTFVDSRARKPPADILADYRQHKDLPGFDLRRFVDANFEIPSVAPAEFAPAADLSMEQHLHRHWQYLAREADEQQRWSSLIPLPNPYVVPGGRFREIYYWDSYFTMHGLAASERHDLAEAMVKNFAWLIDEVGHVPNGNRTYYLSRSQPPFFAAMVTLLQEHSGDEIAVEFLSALIKEYEFWMTGAGQVAPGQAHRRVVRMADGALLNRYFDELNEPRPESYREDVHTAQSVAANLRPQLYRDIRAAAESGWDFSSRWFADHSSLSTIRTTDIVPVDLNSLLFHLETTISRLYGIAGNNTRAAEFSDKAHNRAQAINQWLWDDDTGVYGDFNFVDGEFTGVESLAMVYPLYFGVATNSRAGAVATVLQQKFLMPGGLVTTLNDTGEQWDYPNGWAPLQWLAIHGLRQYGYQTLSEDIAERWLNLNRRVFQQTGKMMEKYNVVDTTLHAGGGEYPLQDGFGWTNGVVLGLTDDEER